MQHHPAIRIGGAQLQAYIMAREMARNGWDVTYIYTQPKNSEIEWDNTFTDPDIRLEPIGKWQIGLGWLNLIRLINIFKKSEFHYVYTRVRSEYVGIAALLKPFFKFKQIYWNASNLVLENTRYRLYTDVRGRYKFIQFLLRSVWNYLFYFGISKCDKIILQHEYQKTDSKISPEKIHVIYNSYFEKSILYKNIDKSYKQEDIFQIFWIGNIGVNKQITKYITLCEMCKKYTFEFNIIGKIEDQKANELINKKSRQLKNLKYLGKLSYKEVEKKLSNSDLLISTSNSKYEGFPNIFIQAWGFGIPVITLDTCFNEFLTQKKLGFAESTLNDVKKRIIDLSSNKSEYETISNKCKSFYFKELSPTINCEKFMSILRKIY